MSDFFEKVLNKNSDGKNENVICNSARLGLIPQREYFDKDIANIENTLGYYVIKQNDFVYNPRKSLEAPYGPVSIYSRVEDGIVSPLYLVFRPIQEIVPKYFEQYFKSSAWHRYIYMEGDSGARHDRVSIKDATFFSMPIKIPCKIEQQKVADFLTLIDKRIEKQRQLVESLKKYKRGLLSAVFERKIRFAGNEIWSEKKLKDVCVGFDNQRKPISSEFREKGLIPYYGANGILDYVKDFIFDGEYVLLAEDGGHFDDFSTMPIAQYINGKAWVNNHAHILQGKQGYNTKFIYYSLVHKDIRKYINGTSRAKLNQEDMWDIPISVPSENVQIQIIKYFSNFDAIIKIQENCLYKLEELKKGLLQQMFI